MAAQALAALLPKSFTIPQKLISTADTLLSLSRQRLPNLKPDEEIARAHACAELACKRLRVPLRLPNIKSGAGAPCRPAVYRKLLQFLEERLADVDVLGTPKKRTVVTPSTKQSTGRKRNLPEVTDETPTKKRRTGDVLASTRTPKGFAGRIAAAKDQSQREDALPSVRRMCQVLKTPKMVPHVYTGLCVISSIAETEGHAVQGITESYVLAAVYALTLTKMQKGSMTDDLYAVVTKAVIAVLELEDELAAQTEIESWIAIMNDNEWTVQGKGADWWETVPQDVLPTLKIAAVEATILNLDTDDDVVTEEEDTLLATREPRNGAQDHADRQEELRKNLEEHDPEDVLLPGLGTMMHDGIDYYNPERLMESQSWIDGMLKQIATMEAAKSPAKGRRIASAA